MSKNNKTIFVSYNTNSISQIAASKKFFKFFLIENFSVYEDFISYRIGEYKNGDFDNKRQQIFSKLSTLIQEQCKEYDFYFDILRNPQKIDSDGTAWIKTNEDNIKNCYAYLFVVNENEISFWQLQEVMMASYYNKPIIYISSLQFIRLVVQKKISKFIIKKIKKIS